ncbi:MAG: hypothetical protein ACRCZF_10345, partial [Gemmataceae bacterium]
MARTPRLRDDEDDDDYDDRDRDRDQDRERPRPAKKDNTTKIVLIVFGSLFAIALLFCGGVVFLGLRAAKNVQATMEKVIKEAEQAAKEQEEREMKEFEEDSKTRELPA